MSTVDECQKQADAYKAECVALIAEMKELDHIREAYEAETERVEEKLKGLREATKRDVVTFTGHDMLAYKSKAFSVMHNFIISINIVVLLLLLFVLMMYVGSARKIFV